MIEFKIEANKDTGRYEPQRVHLKLSRLLGKGGKEAVEGELVSLEMDRKGLLKFEQVPSDSEEPVLVYDVTVEDEAQSASDFLDRIEKPVVVTFTKRPKDDPQAEEKSEKAAFRVADPTGKIHWEVPDRPGSKDATIELDADGSSEFTLRVWIDMWDPVAQQVTYDPKKVEFTHWTGPKFEPEIFGPHPDDLPHNKGSDNNRELSRWQSKAALPNEQRFPAAIPPVEDRIRVRAWPRGKIDRIPWAIDAHERKISEGFVPVRLVAPKLAFEIIRPEMPIPADGQPHELVLKVTQALSGRPVGKAKLSFDIDEGEGFRGGKIEPTEVELTEDAGGEVALTYHAPELGYEPDKSFTEQLVLYRGSGDTRVEQTREPVYLSPKVELRIEAEKVGLTFEPFTLSIEPGDAPKEIRGKARVEVLNRNPEIEKKFFGAHVTLTVFTGPGAATEVPGKLETDEQGEFVWALPELAEGVAKQPAERAVMRLDPETDYMKGQFDDDARQVIDFFDEKMNRYGAWHLFDSTIADSLRTQRLLLGEQLATNQPDFAAEAIAGTELLRASGTFATTYDLLYRGRFDALASSLSSLFSEIVGLLINTKNVGDLAGEMARKLLAGLERLGQIMVWVVQGGTRGLARAAVALGSVLDTVLPHLRTAVGGSYANIVDAVADMWAHSSAGLSALLSRQGAAGWMPELLRTLADTIAAAIHALWTVLIGGLYVVGAAIAKGAGAVGSRVVHWTSASWPAIQSWLTHYTRQLGMGEVLTDVFAIGKILEQVVAFGVDQIATGFAWLLGDAKAGTSRLTTDWFKQHMDLMYVGTSASMRWLRSDVVDLKAPKDADPPIDRFLSSAAGLNQFYGTMGTVDYYTRLVMMAIDAIVLFVEAGVAIYATVASAGVLGPAVLEGFSAVEIGLAKIKVTVLGAIPLAFNMFSIGFIPVAYGLEVGALTRVP